MFVTLKLIRIRKSNIVRMFIRAVFVGQEQEQEGSGCFLRCGEERAKEQEHMHRAEL